MKALYIIGGIIGVIALLLVAGYFLVLAPKSAAEALLYIEQGTVQVYTNNAWVPASNEMELKSGAKVKTADGKATVVFFEGEIMQLEPNTEIEIKELSSKKISLKQTGETLNKITKISGIEEYTIETPDSVATVRGTLFLKTNTATAVEEGFVDFGTLSNPAGLRLGANQYAKVPELTSGEIPEDMKQKLALFRQQYIKTLKELRIREIKKHTGILKMAEEKGYTFEKILQELDRVDKGELNEDELYDQVPGYLKPRAERVYKLTKAIKQA